MEATITKKVRSFRSKETILNILGEYEKSSLSIKAFCAQQNIASASFCNWKKKYKSMASARTVKGSSFATLQIMAPVAEQPALFAQVKEIKIYQPVSAAYLKELLA